MYSFARNIILLFVVALLIVACSSDFDFFNSDKEEYVNGELVVNFDCSLVDSPTTRGFGNQKVKTAFTGGEVIHVIGTFKTRYLDDGTADTTYKEGKEVRYGALRFNRQRRNWEPLYGNELTWPSVAVEGEFKAYYIEQLNGPFTNEGTVETFLLSDVTPENDPLFAKTSAAVEYGHGVGLNFQHLCAHLSLVDLEPMVSDNYFFYRSDDKIIFNNAYQLSLITDEEKNPTFDFHFLQQPSATYKDPNDSEKGLVYISGKTQLISVTDKDGNLVKDKDGNEQIASEVGYFLEPGMYKTFEICYPATESTYYNYIAYDYNNIPDDVGGVEQTKTEPNLVGGKSYTLTVTKSPGVTITSPPPPGGWDESDSYFYVDVEEFLHAIATNDSLISNDERNKGVKILEKTATGTKLLHNVDFELYKYPDNWSNYTFDPNIQDGSVFDGDYHYIKNIASPLFRYNFGTIQNVGIKNAKIKVTSEFFESEEKTQNRQGALCMWNRPNANVNNVRLYDVEMSVKIKSKIGTDSEDASKTHNIGLVMGSNTGKVRQLELGGNFTLKVKGLDEVNAAVLIGGIVGQNAANAEIYNVSSYDESFLINIKNRCAGQLGAYSVGGIAGESSGTLIGVILPKVNIDGRESSGVTSYMGGMVGQLAYSEGTASVNSCIVGGSVRAGKSKPEGDISSVSYIGGIAGTVLNVPVIDNRSSVSVYGAGTTFDNVTYGTGGVFGRIRKSDNNSYPFENIIAYGTYLTRPQSDENKTSYVGNFAGIAPLGQSWQDNYANKNIILHTFEGIGNIGHNSD